VRQGLLDLKTEPMYSYGEWVRHASMEPVHNRLALWLVHGGCIWLWSDEPAGKTHLLHALQQQHPFLGLISVAGSGDTSFSTVRRWLDALMPHAFWMIDLPSGRAGKNSTALFHLIERARSMQRPLLISWRCPQAELAPPALSSRLKGMERLEMQPPCTDADLKAVLTSYIRSHQWKADEAMIDLLLLRLPRSLDGLISGLKKIEMASLEEHRAFTRTWVREYLAR